MGIVAPFLSRGRSAPSRGARAVVTGAGSGIGRAFAIELAKRGGEVICADIDKGRADATVQTISRIYGAKAHAFFCDVGRRADVESLALHAELIFDGPATLVINNAGVGIGGKPVGDIGLDDWKWALDINLWGVVHGCETFAPQLRAGHGGVINVASAAGFAAAPMMAPYNVSKAAVVSLSETMAAELRRHGVTVTVLCPTFVKTNVARDGRITPQSSTLAEALMRWTGYTPENVAKMTLDAHDAGRLYVLPQLDARLVWHLKRHFPAQYTYFLSLLPRLLPDGTADEKASSADAERTGV
ncbi:SDR family NAD(P)-dependent oxidoreductase [Hoyosella sp. YIM 151337]|uniref:SDR family NAD(P)-dependent oxidoreductase n=1 Tax=Hoyosella sp. YIM 151337 TaxID=2992742 RepID=UPI0022364919|nr:SDR family NAD(P)-dependent oxidoreductase [Hoyosella sp. YIM 151337]MCW4354907.1 SDR family NAD(P)-dependent oxidoreductase [Hoyosella sp. YIM 151337]